jgi:hypothetical protein
MLKVYIVLVNHISGTELLLLLQLCMKVKNNIFTSNLIHIIIHFHHYAIFCTLQICLSSEFTEVQLCMACQLHILLHKVSKDQHGLFHIMLRFSATLS